MAIIHQATLSPSKLDLLERYLPTLENIAPLIGDGLAQVGAYRFDDPAGEVGIETHILATPAGVLLQIPLTYRNDPLEGAEQWHLGTMEHSKLGTRWVYHGLADPVYLGEVVRAIVTGGTEVEEIVQTPDGPVGRQPTVNVNGSGVAGAEIPGIENDPPQMVGTELRRALGRQQSLSVPMVLNSAGLNSAGLELGANVLTGTWAAHPEAVLLAWISS